MLLRNLTAAKDRLLLGLYSGQDHENPCHDACTQLVALPVGHVAVHGSMKLVELLGRLSEVVLAGDMLVGHLPQRKP